MRKNQQRVFELQNDIVNEIKNWFVGKPIEEIEFKKEISISVEVDNFGESAVEIRTINFLSEDGLITDGENQEIGLEDLNIHELAYILDEIEEGNYIISTEKE